MPAVLFVLGLLFAVPAIIVTYSSLIGAKPSAITIPALFFLAAAVAKYIGY